MTALGDLGAEAALAALEDAPAVGASGDPDARLQRARRLDWRFLLPDPSPATIALVGAVDAETRAALDDAGWETLGAAPSPEGTASPAALAEVLVAERPTAAELAGAVGRVRPGGWILVQCAGPAVARPRRPRLAPAQVASRLAAAGFVDVRTQLHVPRSTSRDAIVPLDDPAALRLLLRRRGGLAGGAPALALAGWSRGRRWLARLAPATSVLARRPTVAASPGAGLLGGPSNEPALDAVRGHLAGLRAADDGLPIPVASPPPLLLTPRFRASRHVVALVPDPDGQGVELVVKIARLRDRGEVAAREAGALERLAERRGAVRSSAAPRLLARGAPWGLPTIVETAVDGQPLDPAAIRRDPDGATDAVVAWLSELAGSDAPPTHASERLARLLDGPLAAFERAIDPQPDERRLVEATLAAAATLRSALLPVVLEHGDASHPNLFRLADGSVGAVDWELGEPDGLPLHDLTTFLAYAAAARAGARTPVAQGAAIATALADPDGWAAAAARDLAARIGLDAGWIRPLMLVSLARASVGLIERLHDGAATRVAPETLEWLRGHRYVAAWRALALGSEEAG